MLQAAVILGLLFALYKGATMVTDAYQMRASLVKVGHFSFAGGKLSFQLIIEFFNPGTTVFSVEYIYGDVYITDGQSDPVFLTTVKQFYKSPVRIVPNQTVKLPITVSLSAFDLLSAAADIFKQLATGNTAGKKILFDGFIRVNGKTIPYKDTYSWS